MVQPVNHTVHIGGLYGSPIWTIQSTSRTIEFVKTFPENNNEILSFSPRTDHTDNLTYNHPLFLTTSALPATAGRTCRFPESLPYLN